MSKYNSRKVELDGYIFDSVAEYYRYRELRLLLLSGEISDLVIHPRFKIIHNSQLICSVIGDFGYIEGSVSVVEDVKGFDTAMSRLKRKLIRAYYPDIDWRVLNARAKTFKVSKANRQGDG